MMTPVYRLHRDAVEPVYGEACDVHAIACPLQAAFKIIREKRRRVICVCKACVQRADAAIAVRLARKRQAS